MTPTLGKRKREAVQASSKSRKTSSDSEEISLEDAQAAFRRHFEASFKPLPETRITVKEPKQISTSIDAEDEESEWDGISDNEGWFL